MLLKVIVYSYMCNVYSRRRIERLLHENVNYMWLSGMSRPDFRTINRFRSEHLCDGRFEELFRQTVVMMNEEGLVLLKVQYIDGTKIECMANKDTFVWKGNVEKNKAKLEAKVDAVLKAAESVLAEENGECTAEGPCVEDLPERTERILRKMDEQGISDRKLRRSVEYVKDESLPKLESCERHLETMSERNSYNKKDPNATFMRMKEDEMNNGQTKPGYNVQIATEKQFITNYGIYWTSTDWGTMIPFLDSFRERYGRQSNEVVVDSGYGNEANYTYMQSNRTDAYVKHNMFHAETKRRYANNGSLSRTCTTTITCVQWDSIWRGTAHNAPFQIWATGRKRPCTGPPTARDARSEECATRAEQTGGPSRSTTRPTGSGDRQGSRSQANAG